MVDLPAETIRATGRRAWLVSGAVVAVLMGLLGSRAWAMHGILSSEPRPAPHGDLGWSFFGEVVRANLGAACLTMTGLVTAGIGSLLLGALVVMQLFVLLGAGHAWLTPEQFYGGLLLHGVGEAIAIALSMSTGLFPVIRTALARSACRGAPLVATYVRSVAETWRAILLVVGVVLVSALYETFVSATL